MKTKIAFVGGTLFGFVATVLGCCTYAVVKYSKPDESCTDAFERLGDGVEKAFKGR